VSALRSFNSHRSSRRTAIPVLRRKGGCWEARSVLKLNRCLRRTVIPDRHFLPTTVISAVSRAKIARVVTGKPVARFGRPPGVAVTHIQIWGLSHLFYGAAVLSCQEEAAIKCCSGCSFNTLLRCIKNFRMQATNATFLGLPFVTSLLKNSFRIGLWRIAERVAM